MSNWWIDSDISFCGNADKCPQRDECKRGRTPGPGIYSYCLFYDENKEECEYFYPKKEVDHND